MLKSARYFAAPRLCSCLHPPKALGCRWLKLWPQGSRRSAIPALREVGRDVPEYLDPLDFKAWEDAVLDYCRPDSQRRAAQMRRLEQWHAPRWVDHFKTVEQLFTELDVNDQPARVAAARLPTLAENR
jgi:hypothetical protein